ncbi:hypothetical protein IE53DRAFT_389161 [Violaceomyces palustris]|uniref:Uncharacterized protein n=1 Tax=Violaceomyces palustris TaxID=1673888 RepID=A0ACD0NS96_9BASI|nr:hypothetical protein IE53DRAFT_389161 [Violaceomyces palustris]
MSDPSRSSNSSTAATTDHGGRGGLPHTNGEKSQGSKGGGVLNQDQDQDEDGQLLLEGPVESLDADQLRRALVHCRDQRDGFENQYRNLLSKLTTMRSTLGDRLRQDAEELDRREQQIETLNQKFDKMSESVKLLKDELVSSHSETERLTKELDQLRSSVASSSAHPPPSDPTSGTITINGNNNMARSEGMERQRQLQETIEHLRIQSSEWETAFLEERSRREELESQITDQVGLREQAEVRERAMRERAEREAESARGLQMVLEEFQTTQESELKRALGDHQERLQEAEKSLKEFSKRAQEAETKLEEFQGAASKCQSLEREVKEKGLLIGKLRHEAVILNEHLTEALRRLRNDTSESNVDRRLVTNLLLQFLTTPRADAKRFEMLSLIASVLQWNDEERETAGLQKAGSSGGSNLQGGSSIGGSGPTKRVGIGLGLESPGRNSLGGRDSAKGKGRSNVGGDESFSNLFVEFLLSEAEQAGGDKSSSIAPSSNASSINLRTAPSTPSSTSPKPSMETGEAAGHVVKQKPSSPNPSSNNGSKSRLGFFR